ncbi:hypothetical protein EDB85DRAFT_401177 [Lactarius pseudohatsudake]|nr:hypothetical protein EDB85DRAFT_401177 [Lactarius pseudohatsudake]
MRRVQAVLWPLCGSSNSLVADCSVTTHSGRAHGNIGFLLILKPLMLMASTIDVCRHDGTGSAVNSADIKLCCIVTSCGGLRVTAPLSYSPLCQTIR